MPRITNKIKKYAQKFIKSSEEITLSSEIFKARFREIVHKYCEKLVSIYDTCDSMPTSVIVCLYNELVYDAKLECIVYEKRINDYSIYFSGGISTCLEMPFQLFFDDNFFEALMKYSEDGYEVNEEERPNGCAWVMDVYEKYPIFKQITEPTLTPCVDKIISVG